MKKAIKWLLGLGIIVGIVLFVVNHIGQSNLAKSSVPPEELAQLNKCQLKQLTKEKGVVTYEILEKANIHCDEVAKNDKLHADIQAQKEVINGVLNNTLVKKEETVEKKENVDSL